MHEREGVGVVTGTWFAVMTTACVGFSRGRGSLLDVNTYDCKMDGSRVCVGTSSEKIPRNLEGRSHETERLGQEIFTLVFPR